MKTLLLLILVLQWYPPSADSTPIPQVKNPGLNTQPDDPTFSTAKDGQWMPYCPEGTDLIRMDIQPNCYWGKVEMTHKPTLGQFKCLKHKWYKTKPKKCPSDPYFSVGIGLH